MKAKSVPALLFALIIPAFFAAVLIIPAGREVFLSLTELSPYAMGFAKFALLATTGEILAIAITSGSPAFPKAAAGKAAVWGLIGMMITLLIPVFSSGVAAAQAGGMLPGAGSAFLTALFTSVIMNMTFGVTMMAFHRITDDMLDGTRGTRRGRFKNAVRNISWPGFISFVVLRTIPFFWIPAHTVTFMLPPQYRVMLSAVLSIVLGLLLALAKRKPARKV